MKDVGGRGREDPEEVARGQRPEGGKGASRSLGTGLRAQQRQTPGGRTPGAESHVPGAGVQEASPGGGQAHRSAVLLGSCALF